MEALTSTPTVGELVSRRMMVRVRGRRSFLRASIVDRLELPGRTVAEYLEDVAGDVVVDLVTDRASSPLPREHWARVRPRAGTTVVFRPRVLGPTARVIISLVAVVAATLIAGPLGLGASLAAVLGVSAAVGTALVTFGIVVGTQLALNALFPARPAQLASRSQDTFTSLPSVAGAQNQLNPYGPVPVVLGTHRLSPFYGALSYTELVGDDEYLRVLVCLGYGPLSISELKIGETLVTAYQDVESEIREGYSSDAAISLFPTTTYEDALSVVLENHNAGAIWNQQTTRADVDEISVDVTAPEGIFQQDPETGALGPYAVSVRVEYKATSSSTWLFWSTLVFTRSTKTARQGLRLPVPRGQYDVRMAQYTGEPPESVAARTKDKVVWTALRSVRNEAPVSFSSPLALIALRIKATDQLNGTIATLNCVCSSLVTAYNGSTWVANTASSNPADLFRHVLQSPANARAVDDASIDLDNLQDWWTYCNTEGFTFNMVRSDLSSVYGCLADIAAAGRAVPTFIDGKWGVIWDRPADTVVCEITPQVAWGLSGQRVYAVRPHGWRARFINADNGYTQDERIVYDDGYDSSNATLFEQIEFPGVTDPDLIWRHGRFHIAQIRLRPEQISLQMGWQNVIFTRGDRVRLTWDAALIGLASGRVKAVDAGLLQVTLDEVVTLDISKTYAARFQLSDMTLVERAITFSESGETSVLTLVGSIPSSADASLEAGNLFTFGETDQDSAVYRVYSVEHQPDLVARVVLVDDAQDISTADTGAIPEYDPHITTPTDPLTLPPTDFQYIEAIEGYGPSVHAVVRLSWQVARTTNISAFEVQQRDDTVTDSFSRAAIVPAPATNVDLELIDAGVWSYRVRCLFSDGTNSDWTTLSGLILEGLVSAPDNVTNLHQYAVDGRAVLDWTPIVDVRTHFYEVRKGTSWDVGLVVADSLADPPFPTAGDGTYHVRAYVLTPYGERIYSDGTATIAIVDSVFIRNIIVERDEQDLGWPGRLDRGVIDGSFIRTDSGASDVAEDWAQEVIDTLALSGLHIAVYVSPQIVDIGQASECRFWTEYEGVGVLQGEDVLGIADFLGSTDVLGSASTRFIQAFPIWQFGEDGTTDIFSSEDVPDVFAPTDVFTGGVNWGNWVHTASGTRKARFFRSGMVLITDKEDVDATGTKFHWFVDVPDRTDDYTNLVVPASGLAVTFYEGGYDGTPAAGASALPFNGGPNGATAPHVQRAIIDPTDGDEVKVTNVTVDGCTVYVVNAGVNVSRTGVELLVRGY